MAEVEQGRRWRAAGLSAMERLDLPGALVGASTVELTGNREFYMERHRGVLSYSTELVEINGGDLVIRVSGTDLQLLAMTEEELRIGGRIDKVELVG